MIYHDNLENLILDRHKSNNADELFILSGYTGPSPISKLSSLQIKSTVIHGIQSQISKSLKAYQTITSNSNCDVYIKNTYNHSKIYCWLRNNYPVEILSGSANFSTAGLNSAFKGETLFEVKKGDWSNTHNYLMNALQDSIISTSYTPKILAKQKLPLASSTNQLDRVLSFNPPKAEIYVGGRGRKMQPKSGWNWGHGSGNNAPGVAEQRIRTALINDIPQLFPNNGVNVNYSKGQKLKNTKANAEILFDDGFVMDASFEQNGGKNSIGQTLYKAFSSYPDKATYGKYIRKRLGLSPTSVITDADLKKRGKDTITLELLSPGVYFCDFS